MPTGPRAGNRRPWPRWAEGVVRRVAGGTEHDHVQLPGPLARLRASMTLTMSDVPRAVARGGLHRIDGNAIYVSTGVGMERAQAPQVRLFSRPSIGVLELV